MIHTWVRFRVLGIREDGENPLKTAPGVGRRAVVGDCLGIHFIETSRLGPSSRRSSSAEVPEGNGGSSAEVWAKIAGNQIAEWPAHCLYQAKSAG